ncbi:MAG: hypothetical protein AAF126_00345, partial [Chloroflexota bacterium]
QKATRKNTKYKAWRIDSVTYRVPNEDVFSIVNTIDKMAQKRALIAAVLIGANASEFFTQDVEDLPDFQHELGQGSTVQSVSDDIVEGEFEETTRQSTQTRGRANGGNATTPHRTQPTIVQGGSSGSSNDNYKKIQNRRAKVIQHFNGQHDATAVMAIVKGLGIDEANTESADIIKQVEAKLAQAS